jgi:hypothetical protein
MKTLAAPFFRASPFKLFLLLAAMPLLAVAGDIQAWLVINTGNPAAPETILTTDVLEKANLVRGNWKVSGTGVLQGDPVSGSAPVFRMFHPLPKGGVARMLAVSQEDADARTKVGYVTEGNLGNVSVKAGPDFVPVIRFIKDGKYLWVISAADQTWATKAGWTREKVVFWLWPSTYR